MNARSITLVLALSMLVFVFYAGCGADKEVGTDPYASLAGGTNNIWKFKRTVTDAEHGDVLVTITLKLTSAKTYTRNTQGIAGGDIIDTYDDYEAGSFVATDTEITFSPDGKAAYSITWRKLPGSGDLELTFSNGTIEVFTYEPYSGNEYSS